jgi:hypothetical protein
MGIVQESSLTGCHGILEHKDTVWKRCPKALECQRYAVRQTADTVFRLYCHTVEFEHFVSVK